MSTTDIKSVVKEKYGQAALARETAAAVAAAEPPRPASRAATLSLLICTTPPRRDKFPKRPFSPRWGAEIRLRWRS